jgi:histidine triad (HIT) family protein
MDCIFCKIVNGDIPSNKVYEDDTVLAFHDIAPQMPVHVIVIPKMHIDSAFGVNEENSTVIGHIFEVIAKIAKDLGLDNGFRVINNCGEDGGQTVKHIHFHILGGEKLGEKLVK